MIAGGVDDLAGDRPGPSPPHHDYIANLLALERHGLCLAFVRNRQVVNDVLSDLGVQYVALSDMLQPGVDWNARILNELERSDVVVLLLGHRYNSIDPKSGLGWVEAEFRAARRLNKPILAFLADDQAPSRPHRWIAIVPARSEVLSNDRAAKS